MDVELDEDDDDEVIGTFGLAPVPKNICVVCCSSLESDVDLCFSDDVISGTWIGSIYKAKHKLRMWNYITSYSVTGQP